MSNEQRLREVARDVTDSVFGEGTYERMKGRITSDYHERELVLEGRKRVEIEWTDDMAPTVLSNVESIIVLENGDLEIERRRPSAVFTSGSEIEHITVPRDNMRSYKWTEQTCHGESS